MLQTFFPAPPCSIARPPSRSRQPPSRILAEAAVTPPKIFTSSRKTTSKMQAVKPPRNCRLAARSVLLYRNCTESHLCMTTYSFYSAMLCIRGTSHGPVSVCVCPSVTSRSSTKTAKQRITKTTPHDSPGTLVFWCQRPPRNSTGFTPYEGAECRWRGSKSATFDK